MKKDKIVKLFFFVLLIELLGEILLAKLQFPYLVYIFKPLLMPILIYWYKIYAKKPIKLLIYALIFSLFGDIFLMFLYISEHFFLAGLASFLVTHLLYLIVFIKHVSTKTKSIFLKKPYILFPFILYGIALIFFLTKTAHPKYIEMQIPVIIYASVIMLMVLSAIDRYKKVNKNSFLLVLVGALLFMLSDTLIALNNFSDIFLDIKYVARILIMILYSLGQYLIVLGVIKQNVKFRVR